jgi:hypothetical protein
VHCTINRVMLRFYLYLIASLAPALRDCHCELRVQGVMLICKFAQARPEVRMLGFTSRHYFLNPLMH